MQGVFMLFIINILVYNKNLDIAAIYKMCISYTIFVSPKTKTRLKKREWEFRFYGINNKHSISKVFFQSYIVVVIAVLQRMIILFEHTAPKSEQNQN